MSIQRCENCDKHIDTDRDCDHFDVCGVDSELRVYPPFGYMFADGDGVLVSDEEAILSLCTNLSDDPDFLENISNDTHAERLNFLRENGFRFEER